MKKLFLFFTFSLLIVCGFAQTRQTNVTDTTCFCCNDFYNLPKPKISGPLDISCDKQVTYSIPKCPDATIVWSIVPSIPFTGQGTSSITITPPISVSSFTITVTLTCGRGIIRNQIKVRVSQPQGCNPAFLVSTQEISSTMFKVLGIPTVPTLGYQHYWILSQISNCGGSGTVGMTGWALSYTAAGNVVPQSNPAIVTAGPANNGYQYPGLAKGQCYTLTHYILCCGQWKYMRKCFCMNNQAKMTMTEKEMSASEQKGNIDFKDLPKEIQEEHNKSKDN